jgi:Protein kinase domain
MNERDIFIAALDKATAEERSDYLCAACAGNSLLRERVEGLLQMHERTGEFLQTPLVERLAEGFAALEDAAETARDPTISRKSGCDLRFLSPSNQPGSLGRLGHYEVQEVIGRGGMGIVLRAFDEKLHRVVAIKVMAAPLATNSAARKRFLREARAAAAVCHDHIVTIHAVEEAGDQPYLVMQCVSGMSLQQRLDRDGPLALHEILRIGMQTAAGLAAAHAQGLIHRDIKPANILLENGVERVKITDFGLARAAADASDSQTAIVAGTPQYMAPEQARGEALDCRTDLFSLGSVLYAMCTGRAPYRASNSIAVLKRVCDDAPSPICDSNVDVPEWLVELIEKLQAKDRGDRYQSAAEVATLLGQRLAQLQNSTPLPPLATPKPAPARPAVRRWRTWSVAAAVLLGLAATLGIAEGTGATKIAATVVQLLTPEGTLVVEMTDPGVKVTIEGDGGLVITGAGLHEVSLKPGSYKLQADKNGQPVALERELVSIAKGGREVVKVKFETPSAPLVAKGEHGAFVVLTAGKEQKFETLADAVQGAGDGDTIEVRGNGPFLSMPINCGRTSLTIRAADGFRPVIKLNPKAVPRKDPLLATNAALVLEGLELHRAQPDGTGRDGANVVDVYEATLRAANCRFRAAVWADRSPFVVLRNCELLADEQRGAVGGQLRSGARLIVENCLTLKPGAGVGAMYSDATTGNVTIQITRSTLASKFSTLWFEQRCTPDAVLDEAQPPKPIRVEVSGTLFEGRNVLGFQRDEDLPNTAGVSKSAEDETALLRLLQWQGENNLFATGSFFVDWKRNDKPQPPHGPKSLEDWKRFWAATEPGSQEGRLQFQGGNVIARLAADVDRLTPDDFRLRAGSAGYRAGPGGKDLGADVDLVGPGPAYERWKKTPEYQEWLKDSGQLKDRAAAKPESGAFVLQGGPGTAERKFDTLAEAVVPASNGDTIEIRGNGPFVSQPVNIQGAVLTIRAGAGSRPVIKLSPETVQSELALITTNAALVLEGLELHRAPRKDRAVHLAVRTWQAPVWAANCRFRAGVYADWADVCAFHNCEFLNQQIAGVWRRRGPGARDTFDNCLIVTHGAAVGFPAHEDTLDQVSLQIRRSTLVSGIAPLWMTFPSPTSDAAQRPPAPKPLRLEVSGSIWDSPHVLGFELRQDSTDQAAAYEPTLAAAALLGLVDWQGHHNLFAPGKTSVVWRVDAKRQPPQGPQDLAEWRQFWGTAEADTLVGQAKFQGGNLVARLDTDPDEIRPDDFRLRPDSAGYRAGPDGKDLGADVDLVGPGTAYERWKKMPEYQDWLQETGQMK